MRILLAWLLAASAAMAADNTLTPEERRSGWKLLFDGRSFRNWRDPAREQPPGDSWVIEDGCLRTRVNPVIEEDLVSAESFRDFELRFDWRLSSGGNSGVKYHIQRMIFVDESREQKGEGGWEGMVAREVANPRSVRAELAPGVKGFEFAMGFEFQLVDDLNSSDGKRDGRFHAGALYSMIAPAAQAAHPAGEWNQSLLVVNGSHTEHWINGVKVLEGSLDSAEVRRGAEQRWGRYPVVAEFFTKPKPSGPICLQFHGTAVWFKNLKIRRR